MEEYLEYCNIKVTKSYLERVSKEYDVERCSFNYVSPDVAILMSKIGFEDKCFGYYAQSVANAFAYQDFIGGGYSTKENMYSNFNGVLAPTLSQAQDWLRNNKHIHIEMSCLNNKWNYKSYNLDNDSYICEGSGDSYEETINKGIKETIEKLSAKAE